jgi:hypothetical protein
MPIERFTGDHAGREQNTLPIAMLEVSCATPARRR